MNCELDPNRCLKGRPVPRRVLLIVLAGSFWLKPDAALADLSLETETARILAPKHFEVSMAFEYQFASSGREAALPFAIEAGLLPRLELLIEPTAYVGIFPSEGKRAQGMGDVEVTLTFLALNERKYLPAIAVAGEVKFPTASNPQIGTGAYDYTPYFIVSKRFGDLDVHANFSYTFLGKPSGVSVKNTWALALAGDYKLHRKWDVFAEVMYTTSGRGSASIEGGTGGEGTGAIAEIAGVELIGTAGLRHHLTKHLDLFGSVSFDNAHATLVRTGLTWKF